MVRAALRVRRKSVRATLRRQAVCIRVAAFCVRTCCATLRAFQPLV